MGRPDADGISVACNAGQHYDCRGCKDPCHPRGTLPIVIPPPIPTAATWTPDRDDAA